MPSYCYTCSAGHTHEETRAIADRNKRRACGRCPKIARRNVAAEMKSGSLNFIPDVREHYNPTIGSGVVVRSRRHLKQLQAEHGLQDFDPKEAVPSTGWSG